MASGNHISCGPCMFDDVTKDAGRWCTDCEEGLCEDCENVHRKGKTTRNHKVISIEDYRKIENVSISQVCEHHGESLEWFCKSHDEVLCVVCVPSKHKACSDVVPISVYSSNARQSSALSDLEETIDRTLGNVEQCIKNRESATKELAKQELAVKTMVLETRTKINGELDRLQEKLLQELKSTTHTCKSKYMKILQQLKSTEEMLTKLREQTIHMKQFSSDIQVFLGTRQVNKRVGSEVESIKNEISVTKDYTLKISIDGLIEKLSNEVKEFGKIMVSECTTNIDFRDLKFDQAQIEINVPTTRNISNIKLQLIKSFQITSKNILNITGCVILPDGHLLMATDTEEKHLIEYSDSGEHINDIPVSAPPFDIAVIDLDRIVVTYGDALFIEIMNTNTFNVEKKIRLSKSCLGVSHEDGKLYIIHGQSTILAMDLSGKKLSTLNTGSKGLTGIKTSGTKIFYANYVTKKVYCCSLNGIELWQFGSDSIVMPLDITVDSSNNVYVVGYISDNLSIIHHDGGGSKTLLAKVDGIIRPKAVDFDTNKRTLCVCNEEGKVALYKVV